MAKKQKVEVLMNGETAVGVQVSYPTIRKSLRLAFAGLSAEVMHYAAVHGFKQRLGDAESGGSPAEKYEMAKRIVESLEAGSWDLTTRVDDGAIVIEAVARIKEETVEVVRKAVEAAGEEGPEKLKAWRANAKVKAEMAKIRSERAAAAAEEADDEEIEL